MYLSKSIMSQHSTGVRWCVFQLIGAGAQSTQHCVTELSYCVHHRIAGSEPTRSEVIGPQLTKTVSNTIQQLPDNRKRMYSEH